MQLPKDSILTIGVALVENGVEARSITRSVSLAKVLLRVCT